MSPSRRCLTYARTLARLGVILLVGLTIRAERALGQQSQVAIRDSAGIPIKEYAATATAPEWHLSSAPTLTVGDAPSGLELYQVQDATWLGSSLVIANAGSAHVLILDAAGTVRTRIGGWGDGPGEFRSLGYLGVVPPDSILTYDFRLGRFQVFDREGGLGRTFKLQQPAGKPFSFAPVGVLPNRRLVVRGLRGSGASLFGEGVVRDTFDVMVYDLSGRPISAVVATMPAWEAYNPTARSGGAQYVNTPIPFGATTRFDVLDGEIVIAATGENEIRLVDPLDSTRLIIRGAGTPGPTISRAEAASIKQGIVSEIPQRVRPSLEAVYDEMPLPPQRPAIRGLSVSREGQLWISSWPADTTAPTPVRIFDSGGDLIATMHIPHRLRIKAVDEDRLIGVWTDELGVESVRVYDIVRTAAQR